jgi:hypothetical protein
MVHESYLPEALQTPVKIDRSWRLDKDQSVCELYLRQLGRSRYASEVQAVLIS